MYAIQIWDVEQGIERVILNLPKDNVSTDDAVHATVIAFEMALRSPDSAREAYKQLLDYEIASGWPQKGILVCHQSPVAKCDQIGKAKKRGTYVLTGFREVPWPAA
jgi:ABC-type sugar transport system substrate-binding protein